MHFRLIGIWTAKIVAILVCLFSDFMTFGITFYVPGGEFPERLWHFAILFAISLVVTSLTGLLFWKTRSFSAGAGPRK